MPKNHDVQRAGDLVPVKFSRLTTRGIILGLSLPQVIALATGAVVFIAGNLPMVSEIAPLMIMSHLEEYDYAGASAIASVMLLISFILLLLINKLQAWSWARIGGSRL